MSRELVQQAIHRANRLTSGLYGSDYKPTYYLPRTAEDVVAALEALLLDVQENPRIIAQDVESCYCEEFGQKSLDVWHPEFRVWCIGYAVDDYQAFCIPFDPDPFLVERFGLASIRTSPRILELVRELGRLNTLHHSTYDARALSRYGVYFPDLDDSMLVNYAIDDTAGDNGVEDLARIHTEEGGYKKRDFTPPKTVAELDWDKLANYCCHDTDIERRLFFILKEIAIRENVWSHPDKIWGYQLLKLQNMVGIQMTLNGCAIDRPHLEGLITTERALQAPLIREFYERPEVQRCFELIQQRAATEPNAKDLKKLKSIHRLQDITTAMPWVLAILFYDVCGYTCPSKTEKGERQVDAEQLDKIKGKRPEHSRLIDIVLGIKRIDKKLSTYLLPYVEVKIAGWDSLSPDERAAREAAGKVERFPYVKADGLIHSLFAFHTARSGRSSSMDPNFQNVINDILIKMCFCARMWKRKDGPQTQRGVLTAGDFQQHEVRMTAFLCRDQNMIQNLEKGFHMINLALLEKMIRPVEVATVTREQVGTLENAVQLKYLRELDRDGLLGKAFGEAVYTDYHYAELQGVLADDPHWKALLLGWKAHFKKRRTVAKESTFGPLYGMEARTFSTIHEIPLAEAEQMYETDRQTYPAKHAFFREAKARAQRDGFVQSIFGKKRRLDYKGARNDEYKIAELDRCGSNTLIQGPASDLGVLCMERCIRAYQELDLDVLPIGTVHDSLMNDSAPWCYEEQLRLQGMIMREYPIKLLGSDHVLFGGDLECGPSWGELKSWQP